MLELGLGDLFPHTHVRVRARARARARDRVRVEKIEATSGEQPRERVRVRKLSIDQVSVGKLLSFSRTRLLGRQERGAREAERGSQRIRVR